MKHCTLCGNSCNITLEKHNINQHFYNLTLSRYKITAKSNQKPAHVIFIHVIIQLWPHLIGNTNQDSWGYNNGLLWHQQEHYTKRTEAL